MAIYDTITALNQKFGNAKSELTSGATHVTALKPQVDALMAQIADLQSQITALQAQLAAANADNIALQATIAQLQSDLAAKQAELDAALAEVATLTASLAAAQADLAACQAAGGGGSSAELAALQAEFDAFKDMIETRYGELALLAWPFDGWAWDEAKAGTPLDLTGYVETFRDDFTSMATIGRKDADPATVKWFAAARSSFGDASLGLQPGDYYDPFTIVDDPTAGDGKALRIRMLKLDATTTPPNPPNTNQWKGGLIQSVNETGEGWSQGGGVFEVRFKLPSGINMTTVPTCNGAWPAPLWLLTNDKKNPVEDTRMEFDCIEAYGSDPEGFHAGVHYKPAGVLAPGAFPKRTNEPNYVSLDKVKNLVGNQALLFGANPAGNLFNGQWWTVTTKFGDAPGDPTQVFVNGFEVQRAPTLSWMLNKVYMIVNLTRFGTDTNPINPQDLLVDYVRALAKA